VTAPSAFPAAPSVRAGGSLEGIAGSSSLEEQYQAGLRRLQKWDGCLSIPYFQAYTSTYGPVAKIQSCTSLFLDRPEVCAIAYGTRPDCLEPDKVDYLESLTSRKDVWIELGLQTIHDKTARHIARGYPYRCFLECMEPAQKDAYPHLRPSDQRSAGETEDADAGGHSRR
jgi:radical SAM superfamily enzyme